MEPPCCVLRSGRMAEAARGDLPPTSRPGAATAAPNTCTGGPSSTGRNVCRRTFASATRDFAVGPTRRAGTNAVAIASGDGIPSAKSVEDASQVERQLVVPQQHYCPRVSEILSSQ